MSARRTASGRRRRPASARPGFNYYSGSKAAAEPAPKRNSRRLLPRFFKRLSESLVLVAVGLMVVYSLIVNSTPSVSANSQLYHDNATYSRSVVQLVHGFWDRNKITFDENGLVRRLQQLYPEISAVNVHLPLISQKLSVSLDIAQPGFKLNSRGHSYLVGEQGVVVSDVANFKSLKALPVLDDRSGYQIAVGKPALDSNGINFINQLLAQLKKAKVPVSNMALPARAQELELRTSDRGYFVKFYLGAEPLPAIGQYLAARHYFDKQHHQPSRYLDVRVPGKIFYR